RNHADAAPRKHADDVASTEAAAADRGGVAGADDPLVDSAKHAGEGFGQRGALIVVGVRHFEHVFHDDTAWDAHVIRVSAIIEQQIVAQIFLAAAAMVAAQARRGIRGDHTHADPPAGIYTFA